MDKSFQLLELIKLTMIMTYWYKQCIDLKDSGCLCWSAEEFCCI